MKVAKANICLATECCTDEVLGLHIHTKEKEEIILNSCIGVTNVVFLKGFHLQLLHMLKFNLYFTESLIQIKSCNKNIYLLK